ncbi:MAG: ABC transporter substrate-binding protein [Lachnospiraceae bacterium]|nr:ABC transporter substrate-binding protein [Lachnospiraceae bacterium]
MKKKLLSLMLCASLVVPFTACSAKSGSADQAAAPAADAQPAAEAAADTQQTADAPAADAPAADAASSETSDASGLTGTLKMGMIGPLTGAAAIYGNAVNNAAQIAVDEINAGGYGVTIEYQGEDDEHDAEKSVNAYNNLKDWGVQTIVGSVTTTPCVAVAAEAYNDRLFMLTPSASSTSVTEGNDNVFQLCFSDPNQGSASAQYIKDNGIGEKIAIIYNNADAYSTGIYQKFQEAADSLGLEVVSVTTFTDDTANDFSVQIKDAQDNGADLLFLPIYYTPASLILQQAASTGYDVKVFGVDGMDGILTLEGFDTSLAEGVMLLTPFSADATDERTVSFVSKYNEKFGETPSQFAADGYDCVYAIVAALQYYAENNGGLDVTGMSYDELCEILISTFSDPSFTVDGVTGEGMTWTAEGEVNKAPKAVVIKDGAYAGL